jgi:acyl CoA:acetate/3-ketoacid CoA transferase alpha subunit/acyl CoA:acetate/3-ketoacid CoA transferase beta subunit
MMGRFGGLIETVFKLDAREGPDKVTPLRQAVKQHIKPKMKLHLASSYYYPNAAINEIIRQFWGKTTDFTLITKGVNLNTINFLTGGLVKKVITTFHGDVYPVPKPNPAITRAYVEDKIKIEDWSLYSYTLRLMAGALGFGFMPTNSITGSSMAQENQEAFKLINDPFEGEGKSGILKALIPDISVLHGWAADPYGNTIILPPYGTLPWGAMASRQGVLVTVERLVSTDFIRKYSHFVVLPGHLVKSVSVVPFGAHPHGMSNLGLKEFDSYEQDYDFMNDFQEATKNAETHYRWMKEWILDCEGQEHYLQKVGHKRILFLNGKANEDSWIHELRSLENDISRSKQYNPVEMMTIVTSRVLVEKVLKENYQVILSGAGSANLAAWIGYYKLKEKGYYVNLAAEMGFLGYAPRPVDPFIFSFKNLPGCTMLTDVVNTLGVFVGGSCNRSIGSLGAGQIDRYGNINSTKISKEIYLTGSGGSNDVSSTAAEVVVSVEQSLNRFVESIPYITSPGYRVKTVVSTMGIFERSGDNQELVLTRYFPDPLLSRPQEIVEKIRQNCGWPLKISKNLNRVTPPSQKELEILRLFDPRGYFIGVDKVGK